MGLMDIPHIGDPTKPVVRASDVDEHGNYKPIVPQNVANIAATFTSGQQPFPINNEVDAYWASQPPAVQALRKLNNEDARTDLAHQLADAGYLIDVPIMVWGWDPLSTMVVRKNNGFTWVPSAKMDPIYVMPGLSFPSLDTKFKPYDPNNPPPGSIKVTIMWAKGFENTSPWMKDEKVVLF